MESFIQQLLCALPRPRTATAHRLSEIADPYATVKLDGKRTLLLCQGARWRAVSVAGGGGGAPAVFLEGEPSSVLPSALTVLDAEQMGSDYYVFDALFANGADVRHFPLQTRLRHASRHLPPSAYLKRFYAGSPSEVARTLQRLMGTPLRLACGTSLQLVEGFVIGSCSAPYTQAPVKFKFTISCDFLISSCVEENQQQPPSCWSAPSYQLHVQEVQEIVPFRGHLRAPGKAHLTTSEGAEAGLPASAAVSDHVIAEFELFVSQWRVVRLRQDRQRPNTLRTVKENVSLCASGKGTWDHLLKILTACSPPGRLEDTLSRRVLETAGVSGAIAVSTSVLALFLPGKEDLHHALHKGGDIRDVVVISPAFLEDASSPASPLSSLARNAQPPLPLLSVLDAATQAGRKCKQITDVALTDFLPSFQPAPEVLYESLLQKALGSLQLLLIPRNVDSG